MFDEKGEWLPAGRFLPVAERLKLTPALDLAAVQLGLKELRAAGLLDSRPLPGQAASGDEEDEAQVGQSELFED